MILRSQRLSFSIWVVFHVRVFEKAITMWWFGDNQVIDQCSSSFSIPDTFGVGDAFYCISLDS